MAAGTRTLSACLSTHKGAVLEPEHLVEVLPCRASRTTVAPFGFHCLVTH